MNQLLTHWKNRAAVTDKLLGMMHTTRKFGWVVGLVFMAISLYPKLTHDLSSDAMFYLYMAQRMLDGAQYYYDFFEYNTPFAIGIYIIPVAIARMLGVFIPTVAIWFVACLLVASIAFVHSIIIRSPEWQRMVNYNALIIALFISLNFLSTYYFNISTTKSIIFLCFILPYFFSIHLLVSQEELAHWQHVSIGILLGLCMCLKPHYALFAMVMEIYAAIKLRRALFGFRLSNILAALVVILYYGVIMPLYFDGYLKIIPLFFQYYEAAYYTVWHKLAEVLLYAAYSFPFVIWYLLLRKQLRSVGQYEIFFAGMLASIMVLTTESLLSLDQLSLYNFFISVPFIYTLLLFSRHSQAFLPSMGLTRKMIATTCVVIACVSIFGLVKLVRAFDPTPRAEEVVTSKMVEFVKQYAPEDYVYTISDSTQHYAPVMLYLSPRHYPIFHLQGMLKQMEYNYEKYEGQPLPPKEKEAEKYFMDSFHKDFIEGSPKLVFVSREDLKHNMEYCLPSLLEILLKRNPEFRSKWQQYKKVGTVLEINEQKILDGSRERAKLIRYDNKEQEIMFTPSNVRVAWLDVYLRED
ncbi:MAG: hypothetical protein AB7L92_03310 [Alphaproteobacteria bacterium]